MKHSPEEEFLAYQYGGELVPPDVLDRTTSSKKRGSDRRTFSFWQIATLVVLVVGGIGLGVYVMTQRTTLLSSYIAQDAVEEHAATDDSSVEEVDLDSFQSGLLGFREQFEQTEDTSDGRFVTGTTDTDGDGLSDQEERAHGTRVDHPDTDGDGYLDGEEVASGHDPLVAASVPKPSTKEGQKRYYDPENGLSFLYDESDALSSPVLQDAVISLEGATTYPHLKVFPLEDLTDSTSPYGSLPLEEWQRVRIELDDDVVSEDVSSVASDLVPLYGAYVRGDGPPATLLSGSIITSQERVRAYDGFYSLVETDPEPTLARVTTFIENDRYSYQFITWYRGITVSPQDLLVQLEEGVAASDLQDRFALHSAIIASVDIAGSVKPSQDVSPTFRPTSDDREMEEVQPEEPVSSTEELPSSTISASASDVFTGLLESIDTSDWATLIPSRLSRTVLYPTSWYYVDCGGVLGLHRFELDDFCSSNNASIVIERDDSGDVFQEIIDTEGTVVYENGRNVRLAVQEQGEVVSYAASIRGREGVVVRGTFGMNDSGRSVFRGIVESMILSSE